jgi:hypothetical protein
MNASHLDAANPVHPACSARRLRQLVRVRDHRDGDAYVRQYLSCRHLTVLRPTIQQLFQLQA